MWEQPVSLVCYFLVAAIVIFLSIKLSDFVDLLDKKTKISGAFLGGILLAAVTSLPELFTSLTATLLLSNNKLVVGNILGSDIFNITLFFIIYIFFFKKLTESKVSKAHLWSMLFIGLMYASITLAAFVFNFNKILWGWFNPVSILIVVIYVFSIIKTPKIEEAEEKTTDSKLTVKQIVFWFVICSILLIGASIGITYLTDWVVNNFNMGATFGGALFLGVATSLPEMTATITLSRKKNFNAAYGNILGSCMFNFIILALADLLSFRAGPLYNFDESSFFLLILGSASIAIFLVSLLIQFSKKFKYTKSLKVIYICFAVLLLSSYVAYIVLSNINITLPFLHA